jgi:hypothetical protein
MATVMTAGDSLPRSILLVGFGEVEIRELLPFLASFDMNVHYLPWTEGLAGLLKMREFDAIVLRMPSMRRLLLIVLEALRADDALNRHTGVVLVASPKQLGAARSYVPHGVNRVLSDSEMSAGLRETLVPLLDVAHRFRLRTPIELSAVVDAHPTKAYCHTENLSISGMLVSCSQPLPVGSPVDFSLQVPGENSPIRGTAKVVRLTNPRRENILGMGAAFLSFVENHRSRLRSLLVRQAN